MATEPTEKKPAMPTTEKDIEHRKLVIDAMKSAFLTRLPKDDLIFQSDRGSKYASFEFTDFLRRCRFQHSMLGNVNYSDNAVTERFFRTLKGELINRKTLRFD